MTSGYYCDKCGKAFRGQPALELVATTRGKLEKGKFANLTGDGDYCETCGAVILSSITWRKA